MPTGLSPSTVGLFRPPRLLWVRGGRVLTLHPLLLSLRIRFGLFPLRSPLLREYLLVSLPSLTKMFPFRVFPFLTERRGLLTPGRMSHSGISGSKAACTYPEHIAACRALLQLSSLAIHQLASACSDPVTSKPSLVPETLEPMHGGNRKASSSSPCSALRWQSFLPSCMCELYGIGLGITFMYGWGQRVYLRR